ncbi:ABC transporter permease subunit [bacterium]|nr:ABC transporter permease subunit [bacterium]
MRNYAQFLLSRWPELAAGIAEHIMLCAITLGIAAPLGVALGVLAFRSPRIRGPLMSVISLLQTIPGMALLVLMLALVRHIGMLPALLALILYALLPISRNSLVGLTSFPHNLVEASKSLGMTPWQQLRHIRIFYALPFIVTGLRIAAVQTVGLATLAAFVGAGGLGQFINRGLFLSDTRLILMGAIPAIIIALLVDGVMAMLEAWVRIPRPSSGSQHQWQMGLAGAALLGMALFTAMFHPWWQAKQSDDSITIGSKNFTEQLIVGELIAQTLEQNGYHVIRRFGLGGSSVLHQALINGEIDIAVEYTGTALTAILHKPPLHNREEAFLAVQKEYNRRFNLEWLPPLGFNNSYCLAIRTGDPKLEGISTISDLALHANNLKAAFDFEFAERKDGYAGLRQAYGLKFAEIRDIHPDILYDTLTKKQVDVISAYSTDGRLANSGFMVLKDDKNFFPPYDAAIVVREKTIQNQPNLRAVLRLLSDSLSDDTMRRLNGDVDQKKLTVREVVKDYLARQDEL